MTRISPQNECEEDGFLERGYLSSPVRCGNAFRTGWIFHQCGNELAQTFRCGGVHSNAQVQKVCDCRKCTVKGQADTDDDDDDDNGEEVEDDLKEKAVAVMYCQTEVHSNGWKVTEDAGRFYKNPWKKMEDAGIF
jgi:hypothetical protein